MTSTQLLCIGHRGAMGHAPENTLASIRKALELGARAIEVDVYFVDGHLIVFHDQHLERTTDGTGLITDHPFSYLRHLDAGGGQQIPTLEEVCSATAGRALLNIELKGSGAAAPVASLISDMVRVGWQKNMFLVSAFDHQQLTEVAERDPEIKLGALYSKPPFDFREFMSSPGAYAANLPLTGVDGNIVDEAHFRQLKVFVYTVNTPEDIERMIQFNVDGVFTNYPERVARIYAQPAPSEGWS
ncbi:MAG: glycerophosphodiester phosphodiesterase [Proteobacteria bacterium]|nr:glycerophosphodiester phosphodiesterase [Pseudomonadota bacterium]MBU1737437.1 glycerophosphodiester phosphodiesterase [Pseudomonadota bacterium]